MKQIPFILYTLALVAIFQFSACTSSTTPDAQQIIDQAIVAHGAQQLDQAVVSFKFRNMRYRALRDQGAFVYSRTFTNDSTGQRIYDVLGNSGFKRTVDGQEVDVPLERQEAYSSSINSVIYFALLPYFLNDDAVQKGYLGEAEVKGEPYYKIKVTFAENGGGKDFEDEYVYWFHQQNHTMDYLAYTYKDDEGEGSRFRVAVNPREVSGVRFQDYGNYTSKEKFPLQNYDKAFEAGKVEKVSDITLEEVQVSGLK